MKKLTYVVVGLIGLLLVLVVAAFAAVNVWPYNNYKPEIAEAARDATGRDLRIDGDISVSLSPGLELDFAVSGVHLANAEGLEPADMVALGNVSGKVQLLPLVLGRNIIVDRFIVEEPAINLAVDAQGRPNWVFPAEPGAVREPGPRDHDDALPFNELRLADVRIEKGTFRFADATSGQKIEASDINFKITLADLASPLAVDGGMVLNKEKMTLKIAVDTPNGVIAGPNAKLALALDSKHVSVKYDGAVQRQPVTGLDGAFSADIPSVGRLASWLERPLAKGQPDPGPLKVRATFSGDGAKVALKEATIDGTALKAKATGSFDGSGEVAKLVLNVESGVLDIDRYLPPPTKQERQEAQRPGKGGGNPLAALPDDPIDLSGLKGTEADVKVALAGLKVSGITLGKIGFTAVLKGGVLNAELARLALYGGGVSAKVQLDGSSANLGADAGVNIDKVKVDQLMQAATGENSIVGIASGDLQMKSKGKSPRALAQNMSGKFAFNLGGVNVKNAPVGAISEVKLDLDLPGLEKQPSLQGSVVYNKERVDLAATVDPLKKVLEADSFAADLTVTSKRVTAKYAGKVQHQPVPGLDGKFDLDVPSVAGLASWLGQPLAEGQPDPGPLKVAAEMSSDGETVLLKQASITGKAIKANAKGSFKAEKPAPRFDATVDVLEADLNAYLPAEKKAKKPAAKPGPAGPPPWSKEPIDFSGLTAANGKALVTLNKVKYKNLEINDGRITLSLEKGVMTTAIESLKLAGGSVNAQAMVDASDNKAAKVSYGADINGVNARPVLIAFADNDRLSGTMNVTAEGQTQGNSEYALVSALNGKGSLQFLDGAIHGINLAATLRKAQTLALSQKAGETQKTDFAELGGTFVIKNGVVDNRDFKMLAPLVRLTGAGLVPMPPQTVDYEVVAKLVASLQGQGGKDALAGIPIPVRVTGTWQKPAYKVDWDSVFKQIAADPARLANMPKDLQGAAQNMGIALPGLKTDGLLKTLGGGAGTGSTDDASKTTDQTTTTQDPIKSITKDPVGTLKGLFKK